MSKLLAHVRFPYIPALQLLSIPSSHPAIGTCSAIKALLHEALFLQVIILYLLFGFSITNFFIYLSPFFFYFIR